MLFRSYSKSLESIKPEYKLFAHNMLSLPSQNKKRTQRRTTSTAEILRDIREELRNKRIFLPRTTDIQPMKLPRLRSHIFTFTADLQTMTSGASPVNFANYFTLSAVPDYINLIEVFDQYRILQAVVNYYPRTSFENAPSTSQIYSAIDYEDANVPSAPSELEQYDTCLVACLGEPFQRVLKPRVSLAAYSGVFTSYATRADQWIDSSSPSVQHYGIKTSLGASSTTIVYDVKVVLFIQMRSQL